jgi:RimJ/RimL family protein N-acetyltransferase
MMERDIVLRRVVEEDLPTFYEQQLDPEATEMAAFPSRAWEPFIAHWRKIMGDETGTLRTILFEGKVAGNVVGFEQDGEREVGYWIGREYWGRGIATEALRQFLEEVKTRPLYAHVVKHNVGSQRVLEKCGFRMARQEAEEVVLVKGE